MARSTVWLRRDPVGAHTRLPTREEFRARRARTALVMGVIGLAALLLHVVLRAVPGWDGMWSPLLAVAFCFGIAGVGAAAVALRAPTLRSRGVAALAVSLAVLTGSVFVDQLVALAGG